MGRIVFEELGYSDLAAVHALLSACRQQAPVLHSCATLLAASEALGTWLPRKLSFAQQYLLGVCDEDSRELLGVIHAIEHYPDFGTLTISLLLVTPLVSKNRLLSRICEATEAWASEQGVRKIRIPVHAGSIPMLHFWREAGFVAEPEPDSFVCGRGIVFGKRLGDKVRNSNTSRPTYLPLNTPAFQKPRGLQ